MHTRPALLLLTWALAWAEPASAAPGDAACHQALRALRTSEDAVIATPGQADRRQRMLADRRRAAMACLGGADGPPPTARLREPERVEPVRMDLAAAWRAARPALAPAAGPAPVTPPLPVTLGPCDSTGCWASDGSRLQRVGPVLLGPRGVCQAQGPLLHCP